MRNEHFRFTQSWSFALLALLAVAPAAFAQPIASRIGYVYPAGGRQGASFQVVVGGQFLDGVTNVFVSGDGIRAKVIEYEKPLSQKEFNALRDKMQELQKQKKDAATLKEIAEIRKKIATFVKKPLAPAIAETVVVQMTLAANAEPGPREIRLATTLGLSNPLAFQVGQLPEFSQRASSFREREAMVGKPKFNREQTSGTPDPEMAITLPAVVNGQILPGCADRFRFAARKGQRIVMAASARELIPYLADAVPGWFQATLALFDAQGKEVAYDDDYRFNPDPVLFYEIPKDGNYVIEIKDSIYRGREDFVYRITVGELPFVTGIFPLGGRAGAESTVELRGWNLPEKTLAVDTAGKTPGIYPVSVRKMERVSNRVPFAVDTLPESLEKEPNNTPAAAQSVTLPIIINGRIDQPKDADVFRFEGQAGAEIVAEVLARRLNSSLDSQLRLTDAAGKQLAFNDDHEDKGSGLNTHHADSYLRATLPANGTYYVHLGDTQHKGGPEFAYRLRLSAPRPDFELRVAPSSINVRGGASYPLTVYALRKDGFSNEIAVVLKDAPAGYSLAGARVPAGQDQVRITLAAPPVPTTEPIALSLEGRAVVQGREICHAAVPTEDMMQAFAYRHLVPAQQMRVATAGRWMPRSAVKIVGESPVRIPVGGTARVRIDTPAFVFKDKIELQLSDPPEGITIKNVSPSVNGTEIELACDAAKAKAGLKGNLIVSAFASKGLAGGKVKKNPGSQRPLSTLPAIPFEIIAR